MDTANRLDKLVQHSQPLKLVIGYSELTTLSVSALGMHALLLTYHLQSSASDYTWLTYYMRPHLLLMLTCAGQTYVGICIFLVKIALIGEPGAHSLRHYVLLREPSNPASHYVIMTSGITIPMVHYQLPHNSNLHGLTVIALFQLTHHPV